MPYRKATKRGQFRKAFAKIAKKESREFGKIAWREVEGFVNVLLGIRMPSKRR